MTKPQKKSAAINYVVKYLKVQQKRAEYEVGLHVRSLPDTDLSKLASHLEKRAFGGETLQYLKDLVSSAGQTTSQYTSKLPEVLRSPLGAAVLGGGAGAALGGISGAMGEGTVLGNALRGGVAGAALGGGGSAIYNAMQGRGEGVGGEISDQIQQLNQAIGQGPQSGSGMFNSYLGNTAGALGASSLLNYGDHAFSGLDHSKALLGEQVSDMGSRMNLISRLEGWIGDGKREGSDSVRSFIKLLQNEDSPQGARKLLHELSSTAAGGKLENANELFRNMVDASGTLDGSDPAKLDAMRAGLSIDPVTRAMRETSQPFGFKFAPSNILQRMFGLTPDEIDSSAMTRAFDRANAALGKTRFGGRTGALLGGSALALAGLGDLRNSLSTAHETASPEEIARIRESLGL